MSDEKRGLGDKARTAMVAPIQYGAKIIAKVLKTIIFNPITVGVLMFALGARVHETGNFAGILGKDLKGATVKITGKCTVDGSLRIPALAEDDVKIASVDSEKLVGVVRKTREIVECKLEEVAIDTLPLLADLKKSPEQIPELTEVVRKTAKVSEYKALEKKTLVMTGACEDAEGKTLPAFTDEKVDVTQIVPDTEKDLFTLTGIRKSDKKVVRCLSSAIKYELFSENKSDKVSSIFEPSGPKTLVGKVVLVSGNCSPDPRTEGVKRYRYFKLTNTQVEVLEEEMAGDRLLKATVSILTGQFQGEVARCDVSKFPFNYKEYDSETIKLDNSSAVPESITN